MKVLLDENLPHELRKHLPDHEVFTTQYMGWSGMKNGALLAQATAQGFEVMITMDSGVAYQQNPGSLPIAVVVLTAASNDIDDRLPLIPKVLIELKNLKPRAVSRIA